MKLEYMYQYRLITTGETVEVTKYAGMVKFVIIRPPTHIRAQVGKSV